MTADPNAEVDDPFAAILGSGGERTQSDPADDPFGELLGGAKHVDPASSTSGAFARGAVRGALPAAGGLAGAGAGAEAGGAIGATLGPVGAVGGAIIGGLAGGFGASYAVDRAQDYGLSKLPDSWVEAIGQDERQQRLDQEQHPYASFLGGLAPFALTMRPGFGGNAAARALPENSTALQRLMVNPVTSRLFSGALMGGIELGQEAAQGNVDWNKVAISTGFGLVFNKPNRFGETIEGSIPRLFGRGRAHAAPEPPFQEQGQRFRGAQEFGMGDLYEGLTEKPREPEHTLADVEHNFAYDHPPTLMDAWALGTAGPGRTERTFMGSEETPLAVEMAAQDAQREEQAAIGPPPEPDVNAAARATHPEAFDEHAELQAQRDILASEAASGNEAAKQHLPQVEKALAEKADETAAARRRVAEKAGVPVVETPAPEPAPISEDDFSAIARSVKKEMIEAGRSAEEAEALAHIAATQLAVRAEAFEGKLGTPLELYKKEGVIIRGEDGLPQRVGGKAPSDPNVDLQKPAPEPPIEPPVQEVAAQEPKPEGGPSAEESKPIAEPAPPADGIAATGEAAPITAPEAAQARAPHDAFLDDVKAKLIAGEKPFRTIVDARALAKEHGLEFPEGESANKAVDELVERAVVESARHIVEQHRAEGRSPAETYARIVKLYEDQPNLSSRTSTSIAEQAYSTPAPLAYVASRLADITRDTHVLEPTAGNGMLLMEADPHNARVNELNRARAASLKAQGFHPTTEDAAAAGTFADRAGQMDAVIANPPFGAVREGGKSKLFTVDDLNTTQIDHAISLNALKTMKADGRAVLIIGGIKADSEAERAAGYAGKAKRRFFHELLKNYKVSDIFTVDGDLYAKQGAGWPVDVIVIDGKGKSDRAPLTKEPPPLLKTWEEVGEKLNAAKQRDDGGTVLPEQDRAPRAETLEGERQPAAGDAVGGNEAAGGEPAGLRPVERPGALDGTSNSSEPGPDGPEHAVPAGEGDRAGERGDVRGPDTEPHPERRRPVAEDVTDGQAKYEPASQRGVKLNTLLPANLRDATNGALDRLEREHGNIDSYVAKALGRTPEELGRYFSAEQIDAIGLGISNIQKGEGFIIGDQTGIGKGRVVAAMISYAKRQGLVPVFVTEKPDLYGDMWRDLHDIGWHEQLARPIEMMMTNAGTRVPLDDAALEWLAERDEARQENRPVPPERGAFSTPQSTKKSTENMLALLRGHSSPDVVFTTYDQMNSVKGAETDRRNFLRQIAPRSFLIMDEAHNAGGTPNTGDRGRGEGPPPRSEVFREVVSNAHSVMYSSATYAKSPSVMTLYSKTDMAKAVQNAQQLPELISRGGVPLQQVVAAMLAKAGQYMRRERSFEGVSYDHENVPVSDKSYSEFTNGLRSVFQFDREFEEERARLGAAVAAEKGGGSQRDSGVGDAAAKSTAFSSIMHNVINQMIMALKAEKTAERAIQALKNGEKPVIALSKTNATFIDDFAGNMGLGVGDTMKISFADVLKRYLERTRRVTFENGAGDKVHHTIPLSDMSGHMQSMYRAAEDSLKEMDIGDLPVSPIDAIRQAIQKAGFSVREVTGRDQMLDYSGADPMIVKRPASEYGSAGKKLTVKQFNDGKVDAVILNKSGSTGISMHASSKFVDQRRRRMIIAEADPNIDTHMQMLGRVHRTGQVIAPAYTHMSADIPAEVRPTAVLMRKMASLNANTTGAKKSRFTSDAVDFLNRHGDAVVAQIMQEEPETHMTLGLPRVAEESGRPVEGAAANVTGRLTLLEPEAQQALLDKISARYKTLIEERDAAGTNDLEAKSLDLQARTLDSQTLKAATGPSPFQGAVNLERVSMKSQGRSFAPTEVAEHVAKALKLGEGERDFARDMPAWEAKAGHARDALIENTRGAASDLMKASLAATKDPEARDRVKAKFSEAFGKFKKVAELAHPGATVNIHIFGEDMPAVVIGFEQEAEAKNPVALSTWKVTFAVPNSYRSFSIPLSRLARVGEEAKEGSAVLSPNHDLSHEDLAGKFEEARKIGRETRFMVTGNLLAGFDQTGGSGQIINHTMEDGTVRPAVLMSRTFDAAQFMANRAVRFASGAHVMDYLDRLPKGEIKSADGIISVKKDRSDYVFEVPSARGVGGRYYADKTVRDVYDSWQRRGAVMRAEVGARRARELIDALMKVDAVFETRENQELASSLRPEPGQELQQGEGANVKGRIRLRYPKRSVITLLRSADASTAVHEVGHDWLEALKRDAAHPEAPSQVKADWETTKQWAGIKDEATRIPEAAHEKFANGLVRYLWEGVAPSEAIARVFEKFRGWLRGLYQTAEDISNKHNVPLSPEMREVYGRLLTREKRTVIAPHEEPAPALHDIHTGEAANVPHEHAEPAADRIEAERPHFEDAQPPREIADEIAQAVNEVQEAEAAGPGGEPAGEAGGGGGGLSAVDRGGGEAGAEPGGVGMGGLGGEERESGSGPPAEVGKPTAGHSVPGRAESGDPLRDAPLAPRPVRLIGDGESPYVDKAGNFKRANINVADDVWAAIKARAAANGDFVGDRRAPSSWAQTTQLAQAMGKAGAERLVDGWVRGRAMNAEQIVALKDLLEDQANEVGRISRLKDESPDGVRAFAMEQARLDMVLKSIMGATAEAGRALNIFRMMQGDIDQIMRAATGRTLYQKTMEMKLAASYTTPESIAYLTDNTTKHSFGRMILEYWINGLISGPATHTTYVIGNMILSMEKALLETPAAAAIGAARTAMGRTGGNVVRFGEAAARLRGAASGFVPAVAASAESFRTGLTGRLPGQDTLRSLPFQPENSIPIAGPMLNEAANAGDARAAIFGAWRGILDGALSIGKILQASPAGEKTAAALYSPMGAIPDIRLRGGIIPTGQIARAPSRAIAAIHTFFRAMNYSIEKSALIYRQAGGDAAEIARLRLNTPDEIMNASTKGATDLTLMGPAGQFVQHISKLTNWAPNLPGLGETPILKFIDPFVHIAANIIDQSIVQRTPAGLLSSELRADLMGKNGTAAQDMAQARMIVGTALSMGFGALAAGGFVSGSGPMDRDKAAMWRLAGNQAHSVRIGDVWYGVNRLGPLGMLLGMSADLYDVAHAASQGDMLQAGALLHHAVTQNVLDESFMRGPSELIQAVEDPGRYGERYIQNFASSFVPMSVGMAQIDRASDPFARQARTVMDAIKQKVPGISEQLFPRRDIWGQPIPNHDALLAAGVTAIYEQRMSQDPVNIALASMGIGIAAVDRTIRNVKLTDEQYDDFARIAGRMTKQRLDVYVRSPDWQRWSVGSRVDTVKAIVEHCREGARGLLFMKYPSILASGTQQKMQRYGAPQ